MPAILTIDSAACRRCGRCARVCPSGVFEAAPDGTIAVAAADRCISCGHCVAACPADAVHHNHFPPEKVHAADRSTLPTPDQVLLLCRIRRSNRAFTSDPVPHDQLLRIVEAAHRAPTASNRQQVSFTLVTGPAQLRLVTRYTLDTFASIARKLRHPLVRPWLSRIMPGTYRYLPAFDRMRRAYEEHGTDGILRGATALLLIHTPGDNAFGAIDANLAYQNASLMAESMGISQFYTGFVYMALRHGKARRLTRALGIEGTINAGMALGMPRFLFDRYIDKKPLDLHEAVR